MDWTGGIYYVLLIAFIFVGLLLFYEGDYIDGITCLGIAAAGALVYYWLRRRGRRAPVQVAPAQPKPEA